MGRTGHACNEQEKRLRINTYSFVGYDTIRRHIRVIGQLHNKQLPQVRSLQVVYVWGQLEGRRGCISLSMIHIPMVGGQEICHHRYVNRFGDPAFILLRRAEKQVAARCAQGYQDEFIT